MVCPKNFLLAKLDCINKEGKFICACDVTAASIASSLMCTLSFALRIGYVQVDVIVSEWMGYALLFEAMLDTVLYARDR